MRSILRPDSKPVPLARVSTRTVVSALLGSVLFIHAAHASTNVTANVGVSSSMTGRFLAAHDDSTATALRKAAQEESIKKITTSPEITASGHTDSGSPSEKSDEFKLVPSVTSGPAPGVSNPTRMTANETSSSKVSDGVSADTSLRWLTNGNIRFTKKRFRSDGRLASDRTRLLKEQKPHAIVLSCSDSRVPPEIVFDQALGEIFVVRVAGEALDSSVIASIEYAVEHLGPKLLVVMGHTQCGAVHAAINTSEGESAGSEALDKVIQDIKPRLVTLSSNQPSPNLEVESTVNADGVARDLVKRSELVRRKVESGELVIKPALYRMDSGSVSFY